MTTRTLAAARPGILTGWQSDADGDHASVTEHAIARSGLQEHRAVCGAPLPVVDRRLPWTGREERCCTSCRQALVRAA